MKVLKSVPLCSPAGWAPPYDLFFQSSIHKPSRFHSPSTLAPTTCPISKNSLIPHSLVVQTYASQHCALFQDRKAYGSHYITSDQITRTPPRDMHAIPPWVLCVICVLGCSFLFFSSLISSPLRLKFLGLLSPNRLLKTVNTPSLPSEATLNNRAQIQ